LAQGFTKGKKFRPIGKGSKLPSSIIGSTKPNGIKIMDAEKSIKGMQIRRNKRRKELGLPQIKHFS